MTGAILFSSFLLCKVILLGVLSHILDTWLGFLQRILLFMFTTLPDVQDKYLYCELFSAVCAEYEFCFLYLNY